MEKELNHMYCDVKKTPRCYACSEQAVLVVLDAVEIPPIKPWEDEDEYWRVYIPHGEPRWSCKKHASSKIYELDAESLQKYVDADRALTLETKE